jgi:hypothetical protein
MEGTYPVPLRPRARYKRALRAPLTIWYHRRAGLSWAAAVRLTHWGVWYTFPEDPS